MKIKTYSELITLPTFEMRFNYLKVNGSVGEDTFGLYRRMNQAFYHSTEWMEFKRKIIIRDHGCDLGVEGRDIFGSVCIHHIVPLTIDDIINGSAALLNPNNLISTSFATHNAIRYGSYDTLPQPLVDRKPNDTCPWKK